MVITAKNNCEKLRNSKYPGRGMMMGLTPSGNEFIQLYWTMGRSESSMNRILVKQEGFIKTVPKVNSVDMVNRNLLIYNLSCQVGNVHIVSNGEQTDTIVKFISEGKRFEDALSQWKHENDPPIFTPRISGLVNINCEQNQYRYQLGIIKALEGKPQFSSYHIFSYNQCISGLAYCIHTYHLSRICNPFTGDPYLVRTFENIDEMAGFYWNLISSEYKVGMYIKYINLKDGSIRDKIINRDDIIEPVNE